MAKTSSETQGGKNRAARKVSGRHVVRRRQSSPILECAQVTGKAGENGQHSGEMGGSSPGQDRRLPGVVTHTRAERATGSPAGRSPLLIKATRRLNVQSGLRKGKKELRLPARA